MELFKSEIINKLRERISQNKTPIFRSKYFWIIAIFFVWMSFFDNNSFYKEHKYNKEISRLTEEINHNKEELEMNKLKSEQLRNKNNIEKFAREQYYMKKENEDIFIVK